MLTFGLQIAPHPETLYEKKGDINLEDILWVSGINIICIVMIDRQHIETMDIKLR